MTTSIIIYTIILFFISMLLVFDTIWLVLSTPFVFLFKDRPGIRKVHQQTIPRIGGVCIVLSFFIVLVFWRFNFPDGFPTLSPLLFNISIFITICILGIGFFDDCVKFKINNKAKFLLEVLAAAELVFFFGIRFPETHIAGFAISNRILLSIISVFWIVGISNAVNIIDGIDGLAGTITTISFITLGILFLYSGQNTAAILCFVLTGLVVGFLIHNISPARVFLGDTGSLFFGMILSVLLIYLVILPGKNFSMISLFLIAGFPILDVSVAMVRRFLRSFLRDKAIQQNFRAMTVADSEHIHHRLLYRGLDHRQAVLVLSIFSATLCMTAVLIQLFPAYKIIFCFYTGLIILWLLYWLSFFDRVVKMGKNIISNMRKNVLTPIDIVDADQILYHGMINYSQHKFRLQFITSDEIAEAQKYMGGTTAQKDLTDVEQFLVSPIWDYGTRQIPTALISKTMEALSEKAKGYATSEPLHVYRPYIKDAPIKYFSAIILNCKNASEKEKMARQLLENSSCIVIVLADEVPVNKLAFNPMKPQVLYVKKPFYVPIFFSELYKLLRNWDNWKDAESILKQTTVIKTYTE